MFSIRDSDYSSSLVLPRTSAACPSDNDGVHLDSEPHIQSLIIKAAQQVCGVDSLSDAQRENIRSTFGRPDNEMSQLLFGVLRGDPELGRAQILSELHKDTFVPFFVDARRAVWKEWTSSGRIEPKPGVFQYLNELRSSGRLLGLVTGMPFDIAAESVTHVLKADDLIPRTRDRRVCCDDERLGGRRGKPDPLCYELGMSHFVDEFDIDPRDMWVIEDRANGAVAALAAKYTGSNSKFHGHQIGRVIVIPDENDVHSIEFWDMKELMQRHLSQCPEDRARLSFLRTLEDLSFAS
jgi:beta-phosphoglucomutase-like phosphatase (HAD superfamily)